MKLAYRLLYRVAERQFPRPAAKVVGLIRKSNLPVHPGESLKSDSLPPLPVLQILKSSMLK
jgi:hypothetical protein